MRSFKIEVIFGKHFSKLDLYLATFSDFFNITVRFIKSNRFAHFTNKVLFAPTSYAKCLQRFWLYLTPCYYFPRTPFNYDLVCFRKPKFTFCSIKIKKNLFWYFVTSVFNPDWKCFSYLFVSKLEITKQFNFITDFFRFHFYLIFL